MSEEKIIPLALYRPDSDAGLALLARKGAAAQAELILSRVRALPCPQSQKRALLAAIMAELRGGPG